MLLLARYARSAAIKAIGLMDLSHFGGNGKGKGYLTSLIFRTLAYFFAPYSTNFAYSLYYKIKAGRKFQTLTVPSIFMFLAAVI